MLVRAYTKYGSKAASTRQRLLQYLPRLAKAGIQVDYQPLLSDEYVESLATGAPYSKAAVARAYTRRIAQVVSDRSSDLIWVYAELFPHLPGAFEKLVHRSGIPVIYDFDDAFFHQYDEHPSAMARVILQGKLEPLIRGAAACCCGNAYLLDYASHLSRRNIILPTVVDTERYIPAAERSGEQVTIGWIGSPSTWAYMRPLLPLLDDLVKSGQALVRVVGAGASAALQGAATFEFLDWQEDLEIEQVRSFDIGIMPLPDEKWARGKSGYKLVQYMACGLPVVASPVGVNSDIVSNGETGFLARTPDEWRNALETLIRDEPMRRRMGVEGRRRCEERYSLASQAPRLIELIRSVAEGATGGATVREA